MSGFQKAVPYVIGPNTGPRPASSMPRMMPLSGLLRMEAGISDKRSGPSPWTSQGAGRTELWRRAARAALVAERSGWGAVDLLLKGMIEAGLLKDAMVFSSVLLFVSLMIVFVVGVVGNPMNNKMVMPNEPI